MKILHTADWHIGKTLHKTSLSEEMHLFFNWLTTLMEKEKVDVLLVSGDIFDIATPSANDREVYYSFLTRLFNKNIQVIITGGNHDSIGFLNAPRSILEHLNISIIGGARPNIQDEIIELKDSEGNLQTVVAAVPFLRDKDLRTRETDKLYDSRVEAINAGIRKHYQTIGQLCKENYPDIPAIAMGHLYAVGVERSESERDIHVGNQAAITGDLFEDHFEYTALGHIHRPQIINKNPYIRYSGSPLALSFSERKDVKTVVLLEVENGEISPPQAIEIPAFRSLKKISGNIAEVTEALDHFKSESILPSFLEIDIQEENYSVHIINEVENLVAKYNKQENFTILKHKISFENGAKDTADLFEVGQQIQTLQPLEVLDSRLEEEPINEEQKTLLRDAFQELLETINDYE